ncbi:hypothetical protein CDEN61S_03715 [Castellaniella denitrificans]
MPGLLPNVDPEGLMEYSVVYTDRATATAITMAARRRGLRLASRCWTPTAAGWRGRACGPGPNCAAIP